MKKYDSPISAVYRFLTTNFNGTFNSYQTDVEVIGETNKRYLIRLKFPVRSRRVGDEIWVAKKNVRFHTLKKQIDTNDFWYNKD